MVEVAPEQREIFSLIRELARVVRLFQQDSIFCNGLTFVQFNILDLVHQNGGGLELADLHGLLSVDKSTTTRLADPLVKRGLLERASSCRDTRAARLELTEPGRQTLAEFWQCSSVALERLQAHIPAEKRNEVLESLGLFVRALGKCCGGSCTG